MLDVIIFHLLMEQVMQESTHNAETLAEENFAGESLETFMFDDWKDTNEWMFMKSQQYMSDRVSAGASYEMVNVVSIARYEQLLQIGRTSMRDMFSREELFLLLDANPYPWLSEFNPRYCYFVDALNPEELDLSDLTPAGQELITKLLNLNELQQIALQDVCECAWR